MTQNSTIRSCRYTLAAFECLSRRVLLLFSQDMACLLSLFLPCFSAYAASLHRRIRMFVFLIGFAYLRKWFSCAYCSRCPLAAGYVGRLWRSSAAAVHIAPLFICSAGWCVVFWIELPTLMLSLCNDTLPPACRRVFCNYVGHSMRRPVFWPCTLSFCPLHSFVPVYSQVVFPGNILGLRKLFHLRAHSPPPACWMHPCKEKYSRVLLLGILNNCKSEFPTLCTSRNFHHKNDLISPNVYSGGILLHLSIAHRESSVQVTASHDTGRHPTALDAKRFYIVPIGGSDSHSSMLHPAASPPTFDPLAKWLASWFNAGTQRTTQTDQQEKRCIA